MSTNADLQEWIVEALRELEGEARVPKIAEQIWVNHEDELRASGDLFFTWQYVMRWEGQKLQKAGKLKKLKRSWVLL